MSPADGAQAGHPLVVSGPTQGPWLVILRAALKWAGVLAAVLTVVSLVASGAPGAGSVVIGGGLVVLFSGISLLVVHIVGRDNPGGAMAMFALTYMIKVVLFAAVLFLLGRPAWLDATWFFTSAALTVVVWQVAEVRAFSRIRFQLYNDDEPPKTPSLKGEKDA